jgi:hypothetical protein
MAGRRLAAAPPQPVMLWAWERPGDLRGLPTAAGVAFPASSIYLRDGQVRSVLRMQPLRLAPESYRMATSSPGICRGPERR